MKSSYKFMQGASKQQEKALKTTQGFFVYLRQMDLYHLFCIN